MPELGPEAGHKLAVSFKELKTRFEYQEFGGGPLLGLRGACIICHGSSGARAIKKRPRVAGTMAEEQVNAQFVSQADRRPCPMPARRLRSLLSDHWDLRRPEPMPKIAFLFPGQGAQAVGMGRALYDEVPAARELFDRAGEILGFDLKAACFDGPAETLEATDVSQPAIYVASLAALEGLQVRSRAGRVLRGGRGPQPRRVHRPAIRGLVRLRDRPEDRPSTGRGDAVGRAWLLPAG